MKNRYEFVFLFDVKDANPNGDPDAGNLPRTDAETGQGIMTDVSIKRKIRNYVQMIKAPSQTVDTQGNTPGYDIYIRERAVLNLQHDRAYKALKLDPKKPDQATKQQTRDWMCLNFFDIRTFGAVMTNEVNCGQVRGPVQIAFSRSVDPVITQEHALTRCAVTTEKEATAQGGDNRTMGRKYTIPYGLYRMHGVINPFLAAQTGFSDDDLELLFQAIENAFQFDASAARPAGSMNPRALLVFKHSTALGNAPSHILFDKLKISSFSENPNEDGKPPREFSDYSSRITFDGKPLNEFIQAGESKELESGVTVIRRV